MMEKGKKKRVLYHAVFILSQACVSCGTNYKFLFQLIHNILEYD